MIKKINQFISTPSFRVPFFLFILAILICLPLVIFNDIPTKDVASRYAPMADAFAAGNWQYAFHPRTPILFPSLAGMLAYITGSSGFLACKIISCLFFALSIFPFYGIMQRLFSGKVAFVSTLLLVFCSHLARLSYTGLRDTLKGFAFILALYGLVLLYQNRRKFGGYLACAVGCAFLIITRGECTLYALVIMLCAFCLELRENKTISWPWRSMCAMVILIVIIAPALCYNYKTIGYHVPELRLGIIMSKNMPFLYNEKATIPFGKTKVISAKKHRQKRIPQKTKSTEKQSFGDFILQSFKGFFPYFSLFAIPIIYSRIRDKKWTAEESIVLVTLLGHYILLILQIFISDGKLFVTRRYMLPVAPLAFGWTALFLIQTWEHSIKKYPIATPKVGLVLGVLLMMVLCNDSALPVVKQHSGGKHTREKSATLKLASWIKADYSGPRSYAPDIIRRKYRSSALPTVQSNNLHSVGYLSGGTNVSDRERMDYFVSVEKESAPQTELKNADLGMQFTVSGYRYTVWKTKGAVQ
ncbi:MAG: glycosyltransferase family 39 protein [Lentisphaeria bacterium]|nr:glycosyltransferase family 39 protein [Lentisphaeria bacterium]NQZ66455.1 glycosyltransferase family 39 protein [Lentisphaeria bacterium]